MKRYIVYWTDATRDGLCDDNGVTDLAASCPDQNRFSDKKEAVEFANELIRRERDFFGCVHVYRQELVKTVTSDGLVWESWEDIEDTFTEIS